MAGMSGKRAGAETHQTGGPTHKGLLYHGMSWIYLEGNGVGGSDRFLIKVVDIIRFGPFAT